MKILLVSDYAEPSGGAEIAILFLRELLRDQGHDAQIFASRARMSSTRRVSNYDCLGSAGVLRLFLRVANPWAYFRLKKVLGEYKPDIVHINLFFTQLSPIILPLLSSIATIYHVHWLRPICPMGSKVMPSGAACDNMQGVVCLKRHCVGAIPWALSQLQVAMWKRWKGAIDRIITNSVFVKEQLASEGLEPSDVIWYGLPKRPPTGPLGPPPVVGFAGRLVWEKGVDWLVEAFALVVKQIPDVQLVIAGDGKARSEIMRRCEHLGIAKRLVMPGHLSRGDLEQLFESVWVQIVPSRCSEGFGMAAAEAMMRGTAVVASDIGGLREIIKHGNTGYLVPVQDKEALAKAIVLLLCDKAMAEQMGKRAREFALNHFTGARYVDCFLNVYREVLCGGRCISPNRHNKSICYHPKEK